MNRVELYDLENIEKPNIPFCVTKDGSDFFIAVPPEVFEELSLTDSILESLECRERSLAGDVFKKAEEMYGKLRD